MQSVNTVLRHGTRLVGYNTDVIGFRIAIESLVEVFREAENTANAPLRTAVVYAIV